MVGSSYSIGGRRGTGKYRIKNGLFGCVLQELIETTEGEKQWRKTSSNVQIETKKDE